MEEKTDVISYCHLKIDGYSPRENSDLAGKHAITLESYIWYNWLYNIVSSSRRTNLNRIMQIEKEIKNINTNKEYQQILRNMEIMDNLTVGSRNIDIGSPDDMDKIITVRRRSEDAKEVEKSYKLKLQKFSSRIHELRNEKVSLEKQLFR